ncbi:hypothetical protein JQ628_14160 [Bradyrhizobium lablabi]|uniref:hypothetical protein n=1 Tax=Bradyrhizobium lablabi TaxID=722472 RepID=UPI001BA73700|nr:hypothetical protein [Bradyrhizobium lablabi]MBR1122667.1 hypothetical protein [Bradyrhizobium lablabi]
MSVVEFERRQDTGVWTEKELTTLLGALHAATAPVTGRTWETGVTDNGDAQFYLLGPLPEQVCELCVSRIGGRYVLEDGAGRLLFEHRNLDLVVLHAKAALSPASRVMVRAIMAWFAIRSTFQEKFEPLLVEGEELLVQVAPQLAALA